MKKIIIFIIGYILSFSYLYAENTVNLELSTSQINIGDQFQLQVIVNSDSNQEIEIQDIQGIDNFTIQGTSKSTEVQIISGNYNQKITNIFGLVYNNSDTGNITIGPALIQIGDDIIESNTIDLEIITELVSLQNSESNTTNSFENNTKNTSENNSSDNNNKSEILESGGEKIENNISDIHPVKQLDFQFQYFQFQKLFIFIGLLFFIIIFYIFLAKILSNKKEKVLKITEEKNEKEIQDKEIKDIYNDLGNLSENGEMFSQEDFYYQLNMLFRRYFLCIGIEKADKKTLKELIGDDIDKKLLDIFSTSYMYEFSTKQDSLVERKQLVMNFMIYLKK